MIFVFLFLTYFILYDNLCIHPCHCKWKIFHSFYGWVTSHCIFAPHLLVHSVTDIEVVYILGYLIVLQWISEYMESFSQIMVFSRSLPRVGLLGSCGALYLFFRTSVSVHMVILICILTNIQDMRETIYTGTQATQKRVHYFLFVGDSIGRKLVTGRDCTKNCWGSNLKEWADFHRAAE